jgi:hypothetical protein
MKHSLNPSKPLTRRDLINIVLSSKEPRCSHKSDCVYFKEEGNRRFDSDDTQIYTGLICGFHASYCELNFTKQN